jgi:formylglycine-generating enzyme required for sulfatase activity
MLLLLLQGCGDLTPCEGNIGNYTMDPNGTSCTQRCQCNTLVYEGDCVDGKCVSLEREPCTAKGQKRNCLLPKTANRKCYLGIQTCQPEELQNEKRWSDCGPFQAVEREDTVELCFDGLDNDCDGKVDLGDPDCAKFCRPGSQEVCYTGPKGTLNVGECKLGIRECQENHEWGSCDDEITPQEEICDDDKDNNCNGAIDDGCLCYYLNRPYGECNVKRDNKGICPKPEDYSETEICGDDKDNNCNGILDEGCPCHYLDKSHGVCKDINRDYNGNCPKPSDYRETEICGDGKDNNCDGVVDEGCCPMTCISDADCANCGANQQVCLKGKCSCPSGQSDCSNICVNLTNDVDNCGACGNKCAGGKSCVKGKCSCPSGQSDCSNICVNLTNDVDNCGVCGNKCSTGQICSNGVCTLSCASGLTNCSGQCVNLTMDSNNCGACGNKCSTGQSCCSGMCRNMQSDSNNCGMCGNKCSAGQVCTSGKCQTLQLYPSEVIISAGSFTMGSPSSELGRHSSESPQRQVTLTRSFVIGKYEVTQGEFKSLMGYNPSYFSNCGANCPVENVSWHEALAYMNALSKSRSLEECFDCTGSGSSVSCKEKSQYSGQNYYNCKGYRVPTEAEWEYAYRGGTSTAFYNGDITETGCAVDPKLDKIGWYCGNSTVTYSGCVDLSGYGGSKCAGTHPVGGKQANAWGLHDMAGNVWEWVYDWYQDSYNNLSATDPAGPSTGSDRVDRGGSCVYVAQFCRAAYRSGVTPDSRNRDLGFRFLRSL